MHPGEGLLLGVLQGLTEFLPISSSAHLVLGERLLGLDFPGLAVEVFLHLASVLAVVCFFRRDLGELIRGFFSYLLRRERKELFHFRFGLFISAATFITGLGGLFLERLWGESLKGPLVVVGALYVTGFFLLIAEHIRMASERGVTEMRLMDAVLVGLAQAAAVIPGISRSGATLVAGLLGGLEKDTALRFSFLLAVPAILGSTLATIPTIREGVCAPYPFSVLAAFAASFVSSLVGIKWLISVVRRNRLSLFAFYVFLLASVTLAYQYSGLL